MIKISCCILFRDRVLRRLRRLRRLYLLSAAFHSVATRLTFSINGSFFVSPPSGGRRKRSHVKLISKMEINPWSCGLHSDCSSSSHEKLRAEGLSPSVTLGRRRRSPPPPPVSRVRKDRDRPLKRRNETLRPDNARAPINSSRKIKAQPLVGFHRVCWMRPQQQPQATHVAGLEDWIGCRDQCNNFSMLPLITLSGR